MAENTKIEWTDNTFNPWWGCQKVGPGCDNCYAEALDNRTGGSHWGPKAERRRTGVANWNKPLKWQKQAVKEGRRIKVFCASMADVFDNAVPDEWREDLWELIAQCPDLDWILVTKRIGNVETTKRFDELSGMVPLDWLEGFWPSNVWLLITVVNQAEANRDVPKLLNLKYRHQVPVIGLSIEPMLGEIDLTNIEYEPDEFVSALYDPDDLPEDNPVYLDWVIVGGESGKNARPMHPDWVRKIRDDCKAANVPFFFKQWGEFFPDRWSYIDPPPTIMNRVGKKRAGNHLDGVQHLEFPKIGGENE